MPRRQLGAAASAAEHLLTRADGDARYTMGGTPIQNILHNPSFDICQRGSGPVTGITTSGIHVADRWNLSLSALGTWSVEQIADTPATSPSRNSVKLIATTADASPAAGDYAIWSQGIEGNDLQELMKGKSGALQLTISFWVKSSITGTFIVEMNDVLNSRYCSKSYTINAANTWEFKTVTFPADTTGVMTNTAAAGIYFGWWLAAGSNFTAGTLGTIWHTSTTTNRATGQTNLAGTINNNIFFANMKAEIGAAATSFERRPRQVELAMCQRYFEKSYDLSVAPGTASVNGATVAEVVADATLTRLKIFGGKFVVPKRAAPTMKAYGYDGTADRVYRYDTAALVTVSSFNGPSETSMGTYINLGANAVAATSYLFHWTANAEI